MPLKRQRQNWRLWHQAGRIRTPNPTVTHCSWR